MFSNRKHFAFILLISISTIFFFPFYFRGVTEAQISTQDLKESLIKKEQELGKQIQQTYSQIKQLKSKKITLQREVKVLDNQIRVIFLEIKKN